MLMFGVFDGHGQEGKTVSHSICTNLPKALSKHAACKVRVCCFWWLMHEPPV